VPTSAAVARTDLTPPLAAGWAARRLRELTDKLAADRARDAAVPPLRLRARVGTPGTSDFIVSGRESADDLIGALAATGRRLNEFDSVLDFGCGPGRVLPHIAALAPAAACAGCDVDTASIAWARRRYPDLGWAVSSYAPPLPWSDESFDLLYSVSVFSHLGETLQDTWLAEIRRVLRPGGVALLSTHGDYAFEQFRSGSVATRWCPRGAFERAPLRASECVFVPYRRSIWNRVDLPGIGEQYGLAFHGDEYVRTRWTGGLQIVEILPHAMTRWQDIVVARRPGDQPARATTLMMSPGFR
jgi:SAM-dependent methyltransferase